MPLTYNEITVLGSSDNEHTLGFDILPVTIAPADQQIRVALNGEEEDDWRYDEDTDKVTIGSGVTLAADDSLVFWRETRSRSWVNPIRAAALRNREVNLWWTQRLYVLQELAEILDLAEALGEGAIETFDNPYDRGTPVQEYAADPMGEDTFVYDEIEFFPTLPGAPQNTENLIAVEFYSAGSWNDMSEYSTFTVIPATKTVVLDNATGDAVRIRRVTPNSSVLAAWGDGSGPKNAVVEVNETQLRFLTEELPPFPAFYSGSLLGNPLHPRDWNFLIFSASDGPEFVYGGKSWGGDGQILIWNNDELLVEGTDYMINRISHKLKLLTDRTGKITVGHNRRKPVYFSGYIFPTVPPPAIPQHGTDASLIDPDNPEALITRSIRIVYIHQDASFAQNFPWPGGGDEPDIPRSTSLPPWEILELTTTWNADVLGIPAGTVYKEYIAGFGSAGGTCSSGFAKWRMVYWYYERPDESPVTATLGGAHFSDNPYQFIFRPSWVQGFWLYCQLIGLSLQSTASDDLHFRYSILPVDTCIAIDGDSANDPPQIGDVAEPYFYIRARLTEWAGCGAGSQSVATARILANESIWPNNDIFDRYYARTQEVDIYTQATVEEYLNSCNPGFTA